MNCVHQCLFAVHCLKKSPKEHQYQKNQQSNTDLEREYKASLRYGALEVKRSVLKNAGVAQLTKLVSTVKSMDWQRCMVEDVMRRLNVGRKVTDVGSKNLL